MKVYTTGCKPLNWVRSLLLWFSVCVCDSLMVSQAFPVIFVESGNSLVGRRKGLQRGDCLGTRLLCSDSLE